MKKRQANLTSFYYNYLSAEENDSRILDDNLHVSSLFNGCMREIYLVRKEKIETKRIVDPSTRWRWKLGKAVESVLRADFHQMGRFTETEVELLDNDLKIQGHADGRMGNGQLVEIKGMDKDLFKFTKNYPLPHHKFQLETCLALDKQKESGILFSATWSQDKIPWRDIIINYNLKTWEIVKREVGILREAEAGGSIPNRICQNENDRRAVICPVRYQCFNLKSDAITKTIGEMLKEKV